ncbi:hypothetical protein [Quadrisphaera setariae]|uniref:Uncharacterized protein n=1 Tax=Quadrisphaera setariae TaxID=2593304 RepID=A0A5C8Z3P2_9ACTN|nr:hypothetical protein [Quadrisphaera setariae]TXR51550.1 hypothetical protein FMM08_22360 [Quadrisphaera setariae]
MHSTKKIALVAALGGLLFGGSLTAATASQTAAPTFEENDSGETFGSIANIASPAVAPDLILVYANNGALGYVLRSDYYPTTPLKDTPTAQLPVGTSLARTIPVYAEDGETVIGDFTLDAVTPISQTK